MPKKTDNRRFCRVPQELPAGFWEALRPLAAWALQAVQDAYNDGWYNGHSAAVVESIDAIHHLPPTAGAVVTN